MLDVKTLFIASTVILLLVSIITLFKYKQNPKNSAIKYLTLFILLHFIGFVGFILRNQIPDFLSIVIANTLFGAGTLSLYLATKAITNKEPIWHNRYLIPIITFFIGFIIFTYIEYNTSARIFIYYLFCFIYTSAIAWLFWFNDSMKFKIFDRVSSVFFTILSIIFLGVIFQTSFIKLQAYYFSNSNTFMILSIFIMIALNLWTILTIKHRVKN
ncbi:MAG: hypothetical protein M0Q24_01990 [Sulfurimonas sp.]|uniref:hypothetical protein n=1 Tax=Sulfurimonas sp. TaxID=2022749 RepID=UPI0025FFFA87|nr:hypothetical protein [Sulfurimonas sp.]MCK9490834.1 hypothetical protein [Sulfurimonas sp.]